MSFLVWFKFWQYLFVVGSKRINGFNRPVKSEHKINFGTKMAAIAKLSNIKITDNININSTSKFMAVFRLPANIPNSLMLDRFLNNCNH